MKRLILACVLVFGGVLVAQDAQAPAAPKDTPVLTDVQKLTLQNKVQAAQMLAKEATPEALAKAIADLIAQRQSAAMEADRIANEYYQSLAVPGYQLKPGTWEYVPAGGGA